MTNEPMSWSELHKLGIHPTDIPREIREVICEEADDMSLDYCYDCPDAEYCFGGCDGQGWYASDLKDEWEREWLTARISDWRIYSARQKSLIQNRFEVLG